jgi:2,3-bisphosphoglycerate-dependent phosphoglycerate mutase
MLILLRHGQSIYNAKNIFTGWVDIGLSQKGKQETKKAALLLKKAGVVIDLAFTSQLKRAKQTLVIVLRAMGFKPLIKETFALNERHYGALQGKNKNQVLKQYGPKNFFAFRRSWAIKPPALLKPKKGQPTSESLKDTWLRTQPYFKQEILPQIKQGKNVLISAHGSTIRAIVKYLDKLSVKEVEKLNIPCGFPLVYEFGKAIKPVKRYYLGKPKEIAKIIEKVSNEGVK